MIIVKFIGGAKKSYAVDNLKIEQSNISINDLLNLLLDLKPKNTPKLDVENLLIAINGVDSSALRGKTTLIKNDDVVSIIPIIHGGTNSRLFFNISKKLIQIFEIQGNNKINSLYIDQLRKKYPQIKLQAISSNFVLNKYHLKKILSLSIHSEKDNILISNRFETDILMRFAITSQISDAIKFAGIKPKQNFILIALGNKKILDKLYKELESFTVDLFSNDYSLFLKKYFKISDKRLDTISSKNSLDDLLIEKAAILL